MRTATSTSSDRVGTRAYRSFLDELQSALANDPVAVAGPLLNGRAGVRCHQLIAETARQRLGAFFTPSDTALSLAALLTVRRWADTVVLDPACGAGDLLLPIARRLPIRTTASRTLMLWNEHLRGCDVSTEFVRAAKLRMVLLAVTRGARMDGRPDELTTHLTNLRVADGLRACSVYKQCTHIVMNPPYSRVPPSTGVAWRQGQVTAAALFVERAARLSCEGTEILAILPEVLRTGTSYVAWRAHIATMASTDRLRSIGLFSPMADVDVFIQRLRRRPSPIVATLTRDRTADNSVGKHFAIKVGPLVPHRHSKTGARRAFLHAGNASPWADIRRIDEQRRFEGTLFDPPFVVIRRTSRPGDPNRATASLVLGRRKVAVENHLVVAIPLSGGVPICRRLVQLLSSPQTDARLDRVMRCRHLTVESIKSIPWPRELNG